MKKVLFGVLVIFCCFLVGCGKEKTYEIELEGNPTTGYEWSYEVSNPEIVEVTGKYVPDNSSDEVVGSGGKYLYNIKGLTEGDVTILFEYSRNWETEEPEKSIAYKFHVDKNGYISKVK